MCFVYWYDGQQVIKIMSFCAGFIYFVVAHMYDFHLAAVMQVLSSTFLQIFYFAQPSEEIWPFSVFHVLLKRTHNRISSSFIKKLRASSRSAVIGYIKCSPPFKSADSQSLWIYAWWFHGLEFNTTICQLLPWHLTYYIFFFHTLQLDSRIWRTEICFLLDVSHRHHISNSPHQIMAGLWESGSYFAVICL